MLTNLHRCSEWVLYTCIEDRARDEAAYVRDIVESHMNSLQRLLATPAHAVAYEEYFLLDELAALDVQVQQPRVDLDQSPNTRAKLVFDVSEIIAG